MVTCYICTDRHDVTLYVSKYIVFVFYHQRSNLHFTEKKLQSVRTKLKASSHKLKYVKLFRLILLFTFDDTRSQIRRDACMNNLH